jgi:hypothetical protein
MFRPLPALMLPLNDNNHPPPASSLTLSSSSTLSSLSSDAHNHRGRAGCEGWRHLRLQPSPAATTRKEEGNAPAYGQP